MDNLLDNLSLTFSDKLKKDKELNDKFSLFHYKLLIPLITKLNINYDLIDILNFNKLNKGDYNKLFDEIFDKIEDLQDDKPHLNVD